MQAFAGLHPGFWVRGGGGEEGGGGGGGGGGGDKLGILEGQSPRSFSKMGNMAHFKVENALGEYIELPSIEHTISFIEF